MKKEKSRRNKREKRVKENRNIFHRKHYLEMVKITILPDEFCGKADRRGAWFSGRSICVHDIFPKLPFVRDRNT